MTKKVLFLTSSYPFGKGESFINPELNTLSKTAQLIVMPIYPRGILKEDRINNDNIEYWNLRLFSFRYLLPFLFFAIFHPNLLLKLILHCIDKSFFKTLRNIILIPKNIFVFNKIKNLDIDFIYAHWLSAPSQFALLLNLITNIPFGITGHRWDLIDANNFDLKFKYAKFIRLISYKSTSLLPKSIQKKYQKKIYNIYLGIPISVMYQKKIKKTDAHIRLLCIGNLIPVKGHQYLINAINELHRRGYKVFLDLIGSGDLETEIKNQIIDLQLKNYINVLGYMNHSQVQDELKSGKYNIYCQPSVDLGNGFHEGIPVSLMEAMSVGIPCIATNTGSISELIINCETGLLVEDKNSVALAEAIQRLLTDENLSTTLIENAFKKVSIDFNQELNNQNLAKLITSKDVCEG
ncbi:MULTISPECIES: glycosyltransferase [Acinetobacter]|uniref:glycosyltransferase n=1 Tax=Acinetobacter TaxID=469 RepID=UPI000C5094FD|nr:glycosyltransferase [Acinetobacter sp.]MBC70086.1 hypothetical protein [Acinetobacter sp.]MBT50190.1 hypothetical protein [Acinetobacter sp.]